MYSRRGLALATAVPVLSIGLMGSASAAFAGTTAESGRPASSHSWSKDIRPPVDRAEQSDNKQSDNGWAKDSTPGFAGVALVERTEHGRQHYGYWDKKDRWHEKSYQEFTANDDHSCQVPQDES